MGDTNIALLADEGMLNRALADIDGDEAAELEAKIMRRITAIKEIKVGQIITISIFVTQMNDNEWIK